MYIRRIRQTKAMPDTVESIVVLSKSSDITILRATKGKEIIVELIAKVIKDEYLKVEEYDKKKRLSISQKEKELIIENDFYDSSIVIKSELVIRIPIDSKIREIIAQVNRGDIYTNSLYKRLTLKVGSGDIYLDAIFNSEGTKSESKNDILESLSNLKCRKCDSIITTNSGDVFLKLYGSPRNISYRNDCEEMNKRIKNCQKHEHAFRAKITIHSGSLRLEGKNIST